MKIYSSNLSSLQYTIYHPFRRALTLEETTRCFRSSTNLTYNAQGYSGGRFSLPNWPCKPWCWFSPWYCYLLQERCWFFSVAMGYYLSSNFFMQSLPGTLAIIAGTKQLFMRNDNGLFRFRGYYTFCIRCPVPKLFHFTIPDNTWLGIICQLNG